MNKNLSKREKILLVVGGLALIVLIYWYGLFNPLLRSIDSLKFSITNAQKKLQQMSVSPAPDKNQLPEVVVYPREKQVSFILDFIDKSFNEYNIDLISLRQTSENNKLTIDIKFRSSYYQFLGFINELDALNTIILIDTVNLSQEKGKLVTEMRFLSGYR
ncbi:MAG: type II secretion system protein GspM [Candidatus Margulisiibacteriota bacterium]